MQKKQKYIYKSFTFKVKPEAKKKLKNIARERGQTVSGLIKKTLEMSLKIKLFY